MKPELATEALRPIPAREARGSGRTSQQLRQLAGAFASGAVVTFVCVSVRDCDNTRNLAADIFPISKGSKPNRLRIGAGVLRLVTLDSGRHGNAAEAGGRSDLVVLDHAWRTSRDWRIGQHEWLPVVGRCAQRYGVRVCG